MIIHATMALVADATDGAPGGDAEACAIGAIATRGHGLFIEARRLLVACNVSLPERMGLGFAFPTRTVHVSTAATAGSAVRGVAAA